MTKELASIVAGLSSWLMASAALFVSVYLLYYISLSLEFPLSFHVAQTAGFGLLMTWPLTLEISLIVAGFLGFSVWTGARKRFGLPPLGEKKSEKKSSESDK